MCITINWSFSLFVFEKAVGKLGYHCRRGKCDLLRTNIDPNVYVHGVGFAVPGVIILLSYVLIWCHVRRSSRFLRNVG